MTPLGAAVCWLWLGMVLAISFLEAPLKFRVVDIATGLGIGRVVFRALNTVEAALAVVLGILLLTADLSALATCGGVASMAVLLVQLVAVRPALTRRSDAVLAGTATRTPPRSHAHWWYVGLEVLKVAALVVAGVALL